MSYSHIIFDLDGTLCDPGYGITDSVKYALKQMGIMENDYAKLSLFVGPPLHHSFVKLYNMDDSTAEKAVAIYRKRFKEYGIKQYAAYPGIIDMLNQLKSQNVKMVIVTSKIKLFAEQILTESKIIDYFSYISADVPDVPREKAETIAEALDYLKDDDISSIIMVGDKEHDIIGANSNGIDSIGVLYGYGTQKDLEKAEATYIAKDVDDLMKLLTA